MQSGTASWGRNTRGISVTWKPTAVFLNRCVPTLRTQVRFFTNTMERSHWEAESRSAGQEILRLLLNPKVHYRVNKSQSLVHCLSQRNPVHIHQPYSSKIIIILAFHLRLGLPRGPSLWIFHSSWDSLAKYCTAVATQMLIRVFALLLR